MSVYFKRRMGVALVGALVSMALCVGMGSSPVLAQEDAGVGETAPREGIWIDFLFGTDIDPETRAVVGEAGVFPADVNRIYCFTRVHGMSPPTAVTHAWYHEGRTMARVDLPVRSENWRTWSYKTCLPEWTGQWEVKVLDEDGMVLGSAGFEVK